MALCVCVSLVLCASPSWSFDEAIQRRTRAPSFTELEHSTKPFSPKIEHFSTLPKDSPVLGVQRVSNEVWAVVEDLDLFLSTVFWLWHSTDGGLTWEPPIDSGLRYPAQPSLYGATVTPRIRGEQVQLTLQEPDSERGRAKGFSASRYETTLSALRRDSDADGVPDVVEAQSLTNPHLADSDGDGLNDGEDPLPNVPWSRRAPSRRAALLEALAQHQFGSKRSERPMRGVGALIIAREELTELTALGHQLIVFTEDEAKADDSIRGLRWEFLDDDDEHITVNAGSSLGGLTLRATFVDGHWVIETMSVYYH